MHRSLLYCLATVLSALSASAIAQNQAAAPDPYRDEPLVFERLETTTAMHADGTGETTVLVSVRVQSEGAARQFSVLNLSYASANSTGYVDFARVHKADGTTVNTPVDDAIEMPAEVSREAPMYSDVKEKHLPVRSLAAGDRLEYQFRTVTTKALAPGQFWGAEHFAVQNGVILKQTLTLQVPAQTYVQVWSPNHPATPVTHDGVKTWTWTSSQPRASARDENGRMTAADVKDPDEDADGRKLPSVAWTTFHNWAEVGDWYRGLAEQRLQPTATVRARADELTKSAKTPQEQAELLYRFVATQIRYISISFGVGRFQPHTPDEVLDHGYGDCKDKDTLLESLLRAKGLTTAPVLIGAGIAPVPEVPTPAVFNHVITTVELPGSGRTWLDATAGVAPFRLLVPVIRDQKALVVPSAGPATLQMTPADPPYAYFDRFSSVTALDEKGVLKGHIELTSRSDNELSYRLMLQQLAPAQWDQAMQYISNAMNFGGKVSHADLHQADPVGPVHISYDYLREDFGDWKNNRIYSNLPALEVVVLDREKAPEHDVDLGAPRTLEARSVITLPAGYRAELPNAVHVKRAYATYDKTFRLSDGRLTIDRTVVVKQHKLAKAEWKDYLAFQKEIGMEDGEPYIVLIAGATNSRTALSSHPDATVRAEAPYSPDITAVGLLQHATAAEKYGDFESAREDLKRAMTIDPHTPYLMSMQGWLAWHDGKVDEAIADVKAELRDHPDANDSIVLLLARAYARQKRYSDAAELLKQYSSRNSFAISEALANVQTTMGDDAAALITRQELLQRNPGNRQVQGQIASTLYSLHRNEEAAMAAKKAMEGSDDPGIINNNVYVLSETRLDLPFAETQSRRSVDLLEKATAAHALEEANAKAFAESANLAASWDTLGYILLLENKPKEAEAYLRAAWFDGTNIIMGNHLGQAYEAEGRRGDALWIYQLAAATERAADAREDFAQVKGAIERLEKAGVKPSSGEAYPSSTLALRTFKIRNPSGAEGGGTLRVQLSPDGIADAMLVSGDATLKPLLAETKTLKLDGAEPPASTARVLRDAVVYCGKKSTSCDFVLMTTRGIAVEGAEQKE